MHYMEQLRQMKERYHGKWADRLISELTYLAYLKQYGFTADDALLQDAVSKAYEIGASEDALTKSTVLEIEEMLMPLSADAKKLSVICAAHAHIDMNWMWGMQETVSLTIDTFRTMLTLMREYPAFKFSQSQASTYRIIEEYAPYMLPEIRQRIQDGRWEVTASEWVEPDKNMPSGESLARHILYTKKYLSELLAISEDSMFLDFVPDTFGHNANVPEILTNGGVKYYYHCRGLNRDVPDLYNWQAPSGKQILVFREPDWYNNRIHPNLFTLMPEFCALNQTDTFLKVYGVGDHGGGPTRRDVEYLTDMMAWPLFPSIRFGTFGEFYQIVEKNRDKYPVVDRELNFIFTGCYTTQTRIKMANRYSEDRINEAEVLSAMALQTPGSGLCAVQITESYKKAWEKILFNHFHDILPGSGTVETREYAMGQFQQVLSCLNANTNAAMSAICDSIDTSAYVQTEDAFTESEGAGVGYGTDDTSDRSLGKPRFAFPQSERGRGNTRLFTLFNTTAYDRTEVVELTVWDYPGDIHNLMMVDADGRETDMELKTIDGRYWDHRYMTILASVNVPAFGYATYVLKQRATGLYRMDHRGDPRVDRYTDDDIVLENTCLRAVFDVTTMELISLIDKQSGKSIVTREKPSCILQFVEEDTEGGMTAWRVGKTSRVTNLNRAEKVVVSEVCTTGLVKSIKYDMSFRQSKTTVLITLRGESDCLSYHIRTDWHEIGSKENCIPQLRFAVPFAYASDTYRYDNAFGTVDRPALRHDVPGRSFACALPEDGGSALMVISDSKYGFRGSDETISVDLIRSAFDPDPLPESGYHHVILGVRVCADTTPSALIKVADCFIHPLAAQSHSAHSGTMPMTMRYASLTGNVVFATAKTPHDASANSLIVRLYNPGSKSESFALTFAKIPVKAYGVSITEHANGESVSLCGNQIRAEIPAYAVRTYRIDF